jgi:clan AA aspartic protease
MGLTHVNATVRDLGQSSTPYEARFLVDTGAIDCMAPGESLAAAGVVPEGVQQYELANGEPITFEYGFARITLMGLETVAPIVFGPPGTEPLLGVVALESLGLAVDPIKKTLVRLHAKPLK